MNLGKRNIDSYTGILGLQVMQWQNILRTQGPKCILCPVDTNDIGDCGYQ